jgi:hypothetical protein
MHTVYLEAPGELQIGNCPLAFHELPTASQGGSKTYHGNGQTRSTDFERIQLLSPH